jgi:hypothetical protein
MRAVALGTYPRSAAVRRIDATVAAAAPISSAFPPKTRETNVTDTPSREAMSFWVIVGVIGKRIANAPETPSAVNLNRMRLDFDPPEDAPVVGSINASETTCCGLLAEISPFRGR